MSAHCRRPDGPRPDSDGRGRRYGSECAGWVLSYTALRQLALAAGLAQWVATLWPLCVDPFVFVATLAAVADRRQRQQTTYAWTLAVQYSAATVARNVIAAGPTHLAQPSTTCRR